MNKKNIRGLFITHDISNYGASRSLQLLLKNYEGVHLDLIARKDFIKKNVSIESLRSTFGPNIKSIAQVYLPFDFCYKYKPANSLKLLILKVLNWFFWQLGKRELYCIIKRGKYDFIHLNSLVLHPVIDPHYPFVMHMRDIYDGSNGRAVSNIQQSRGVIFIDEATREPFKDVAFRNSIILNNPFDMTAVALVATQSRKWPEEDFQNRVIFSVVGAVTEKKGVDFIIRCFLTVKNENALLLVVGRGNKEYEAWCKRIAADDKRIIFWGEERDILKIYGVSDYILRGEEYQCIGRTIYEGLYAGCKVIVPAEDNKRHQMFEYDTFKESIFFYSPRNVNELRTLMDSLSTKVGNRQYRSNVKEYIDKFDAFVRSIVHD